MRLLIALANDDDDDDDRSSWLALNITFFCDHFGMLLSLVSTFFYVNTQIRIGDSCKSVNFENSHVNEILIGYTKIFKKFCRNLIRLNYDRKENSILLNQLFRQFNDFVERI